MCTHSMSSSVEVSLALMVPRLIGCTLVGEVMTGGDVTMRGAGSGASACGEVGTVGALSAAAAVVPSPPAGLLGPAVGLPLGVLLGSVVGFPSGVLLGSAVGFPSGVLLGSGLPRLGAVTLMASMAFCFISATRSAADTVLLSAPGTAQCHAGGRDRVRTRSHDKVGMGLEWGWNGVAVRMGMGSKRSCSWIGGGVLEHKGLFTRDKCTRATSSQLVSSRERNTSTLF